MPPRPGSPHLHRSAPCSALGRPPRFTGKPPGFSPRVGPLGAAWPDPAPPPRRPPLGSPRPTRVGGAAWGRGPRGVPAPRARPHASTPRHACPARARGGCTVGLSIPPSQAGWLWSGGLVGSGLVVAATAGHPQPQLGPRGQQQLVIVQAQRARHRGCCPAPSATLVEASPPQTHSPTSESRRGGRGSAATPSLQWPRPYATAQG